MMKLATIAVFLLVSVFAGVGYADSIQIPEPSQISDAAQIDIEDQISINMGPRMEYFEDRGNAATFGGVRFLKPSSWTLNTSKTPNFGYSDSSYWFRARLINEGQETQDKIIAIEYALLDHIEFYLLENGSVIEEVVTGDIYPFSQRPIRHRDFLFPFTLKPFEPVEIYFKVKTQGSTQLPITLWDAQQFSWDDQDEQLVKAIYYGMMLILMLYNLFLFLSIRERPYLYYVGFVASVFILMSGAHGFLYQYLYPQFPHVHKMSMLLAVPSIMLFAGLFSSYFLRLAELAPRLNVLLNGFAMLFLLCIAGAFFLPYDISTRISVFLSIPASLVIMFSGPYAWSKGQKSARYFTFAWGFLITGIVVSASSKFGVLPRNGFTEHALNWGSVIEALLLSFALADRFNQARLAKYEAQRAQLQETEQRKTAETKLFYQATHQPIDGFPNIVLLQQVLHKLLHSENESLRHLSLLFIHLNRIQEINKTLGHANADIVLGLFSKRLLSISEGSESSLLIERAETGNHYFAHIEGVIFAHLLRTGEATVAQDV